MKHGDSKLSNSLGDNHSPMLQAIVSRTGVSINQRLHESKSNFVEKKVFHDIILVRYHDWVGCLYTRRRIRFFECRILERDYFGVVGAISGNLATRLKYFFNIDDALDLFAVHGIPGIVGSLLTGIFANDLYDSKGGWVKGHWKQFGYQLLGLVVTSAYVFIMSMVFLYLIDLIPGFHLRIDKDFNRREREKTLKAKQLDQN